MFKFGITSLAAYTIMASSAFAQDMAAVDPAAGLPSIEPVKGQCEIVAAAPEPGDPTDGMCLAATQTFLTGLSGLPAASSDQSITNLVLALAPLAQDDGICNSVDDEIAAAIRLAAGSSSTPEQQLQLAEIADTVADDCATGATAAIPPPLVDNGGSQSPS